VTEAIHKPAARFIAPQNLPAWKALADHAQRLAGCSLLSLFDGDMARAKRFSLNFVDPAEPWHAALIADFSKQYIDDAVLDDLIRLAHEARLSDGVRRLFSGEALNFTEGRAAAHMAMRGSCPPPAGMGSDMRAIRAFAFALRDGEFIGSAGKPIRHLVNIGIGGSDLGPRLVTEALADSRMTGGFEVDFVANIDPLELDTVLARSEAASTLFLISSKSFSTAETLVNAGVARHWLRMSLGRDADLGAHFAAVSNAIEAATAFGIRPDRIFPLPEWIGGRYSVWAATGLPAIISIGGMFDAFLAGAKAMDDHFRTTPIECNLPVLLALIGLWNVDFIGIPSLAALPYAHSLRSFPAWLQQLEMESNGKRALRDGSHTEVATAPIVWGAAGTVGQHAFHQLLYQGSHRVALDFIVPVGGDEPRQRALVDNALAQSAALMVGRNLEAARAALAQKGLPEDEIERLAPHLVCEGNQPSTTLLLPQLDASHLGMLLALYEHKTFVQAWIWGINPFDQYGVELGKEMARALAAGQTGEQDTSTTRLAKQAETLRQTSN
jgi:glucose-6-phosphate isomerase